MATLEAAARPPSDFSSTMASTQQNKDEVESPSISAPHALARFEFEFGRGNEGTKIVMVEWEDDEHTRNTAGEWQVTWDGMRAVLPVEDKAIDNASELQSALKDSDSRDATVAETGGTHRMYFLLLPKVAVPPIVTLTYQPRDGSGKRTVWTTNPLPAIFPPELGASARTAGKKGVLHTIWAKQRLRTLQKELDDEARENAESVGLAMISSEQEWIGEHFGVQARAGSDAPRGSVSAQSPGGGRLTDKLRGLKLGTSEQALTPRTAEASADWQNPLSPESSDVAVSSFAAIKGPHVATSISGTYKSTAFPSTTTNTASTSQSRQSTDVSQRRVTPQAPPEAIVQQQQRHAQRDALHSFGGIASMISETGSTAAPPPKKEHQPQQQQVDGGEEGLFAVPLSVRSPDMAKSPFSFPGGVGGGGTAVVAAAADTRGSVQS